MFVASEPRAHRRGNWRPLQRRPLSSSSSNVDVAAAAAGAKQAAAAAAENVQNHLELEFHSSGRQLNMLEAKIARQGHQNSSHPKETN